jgi:hypothetical protein
MRCLPLTVLDVRRALRLLRGSRARMAAAEVTDANFREVVVQSPGAYACGQCTGARCPTCARIDPGTPSLHFIPSRVGREGA